ncbi:hypothetical protein BN85407460 [Alteracholeplasma palmae J233]|uniref:Uncharacterized protein n=1 Tax=Alteracholeplasma palmae (strain ATCC 49389 / J233) TaxID=1318466 RepID=U4KKW0_ALTPJ|nr:hypothetical protein [Alteracholeplasma palmae]CCV64323.1 hypothetical protein BN85407460 [Alteracholeplasma palmae J233]
MQYERLDSIIQAHLETLKRPGLVSIVKEAYYCLDNDAKATLQYLEYLNWKDYEIKEAIRLLARYENNRIKYPELINSN